MKLLGKAKIGVFTGRFSFVVINDNWQLQIDEESVLFTKLFLRFYSNEGKSPIKIRLNL